MSKSQKAARFIVVMLFCSFFAAGLPQPTSSQSVRVLVDRAHGNLYVDDNAIANFTREAGAWGLDVVASSASLGAALNRTVGMFIVSSPAANLTSEELSALNQWVSEGGTVWLAAGSEVPQSPRILNDALRVIGATLRFENLFVVDTELYAASFDMPVAPIINHALLPEEAFTLNVRSVAAYRPIPIIGIKDGNPTTIDLLGSPEVRWLAKTSSTSTSRSLAGLQAPLIYSAGNHESYTIVAVETLRGGGRLILTGSPLFSNPDTEGGKCAMFTYRSASPFDNVVLVRNLASWLLGREIESTVEPTVPVTKATQTSTVVLDIAHSNAYVSDVAIFTKWTSFLTDFGFEPRVLRGNITEAELEDADILVIISPGAEYSTSELAGIGAWMVHGGKQLWLAAAGDNPAGEAPTGTTYLNSILNIVQSSQRFDHGTVFDTQLNVAGGAHRTLAAQINRVEPLAENLRTLYFSTSSPIAAYDTSTHQATRFNFTQPPVNVTWIARTTPFAAIKDLDNLNNTEVYVPNETGHFPLITTEGTYGSEVILFGAPIFMDVDRMFSYPAPGGYPSDNILLIRKLLEDAAVGAAIATTAQAAAEPSSIIEGQHTSFKVNYTYSGYDLENLTSIETLPVQEANVTIQSGSLSLTATSLGNGTYTATTSVSTIGRQTLTISSVKTGYLSQTSTVSLQVSAAPARYAPYFFGLVLFISIITAVYVVIRRVT